MAKTTSLVSDITMELRSVMREYSSLLKQAEYKGVPIGWCDGAPEKLTGLREWLEDLIRSIERLPEDDEKVRVSTLASSLLRSINTALDSVDP